MTSKTKTHICHAIVKSTITYVAETGCLKAKTTAKLNSTEMDFWRRSARISRKDKIRNTIIKQNDMIHLLTAIGFVTRWQQYSTHLHTNNT